MTQFTPEWKLTVNGVDLTGAAISRISHNAGRSNIYSQPTASTLSIVLVSLNNTAFSINVNDGVSLQVKDTSGSYVSLFGGNVTDVAVSVGATGSVGRVINYSIIALGSLAKLPKIITTGILSQDQDGDQIYALLGQYLVGDWISLSAGSQWNTYSATETWANAANLGLGEIDRPGQYTMENRTSKEDTTANIVSQIANSAFGYVYEDSSGNIGYADAAHRQTYLANNGYVEISANTAIGSGLSTKTITGDIRNSIAINYGNNYGSQKTASDAASIKLYGYKGETINSLIHDATDAQAIANRYIQLRAYPRANFDSITFPITNPELDNTDRDALLGIFMGQPIKITDIPTEVSPTGQFEGFVEGWSWSTSFNQLFLTINLTPIEFSLVAAKWSEVSGSEAWNTLSSIITWNTAIGVIA
jgi:hypothetical protein